MAAITRTGKPSLASGTPPANHQHASLVAGEALVCGDACYIKPADGKVYRSVGTTLAADAAHVDGYAMDDYEVGRADVTLYWGVTFRYGSGLTPGKRVFLASGAGNEGTLVDAATTGGITPIGHVIDGTRVFLTKSNYV